MKNYNIEGLKILNGAVKGLNVADRDAETGKVTEEQRCEITSKKCRYLFTLENAAGETKNVSAGVLLAAGVTQKEVDKAYCIGYYADKPAGKPRMTVEEKAETVTSWLNENPASIEENNSIIDRNS